MTEKMIAKTIEMTDEAINGMVASGADLVETGIDAVKESAIKKQEVEAEIFETASETIANVAENVLDAAQTSQEDIDLLKAYKDSKVLDAWIETIKNDETMSSQEKIDAYKEVREEERQAEASASQEQDKKCRRITKAVCITTAVVAGATTGVIFACKMRTSLVHVPDFLLSGLGRKFKDIFC